VRQAKVDQIIAQHRKEIYAKGCLTGVRYARAQIIEFLEAHSAHGDILTIEEIIKELNYWEVLDNQQLKGLADGQVASIYSLEQGPDICEDCFGPELCIVCERVVRG
jgi:hypothetical protein